MKTSKPTSAETGLPGRPKTSVRPRVPNASGLPGLLVDGDVLYVVSTAEVEGIERRGVPDEDGNLGRFRVGRVLEAEKHPNADRLQLCRVDVGEGEPRQIVCGAWNFGAGATVAVAEPLRPCSSDDAHLAARRQPDDHRHVLERHVEVPGAVDGDRHPTAGEGVEAQLAHEHAFGTSTSTLPLREGPVPMTRAPCSLIGRAGSG
jgi:hypothetical protein